MIGLGGLVLAGYLITPVRLAWYWFRTMPVPLQVGIVVAGVGLTVLMLSLGAERWRDNQREGDLSAD
jgi:hypothetical protein